MYLLLYENLPLRTTRMLGDFASDEPLPHRLGDLRSSRFELLKLTASEWFVADHAMEVTAVYIEDEPTQSFEAQLRNDGAGNVWTVVVLGAPAAPDVVVTASGVGRLDSVTGRLLDNPADIMEYMLRLGGRPEIFPLLRNEAAAEGITLAGSIDEFKSVREWLDNVAYSAGAIWTPELARLYPITTVRGEITDLTRFNSGTIVPSMSVDDTCDILRVSYNIDESTDRALAYVELSARPYQYGGVAKEVKLDWVRTATNAEAIGKRMLRRMAGTTRSVTLTAKGGEAGGLRPCQWARLVDHPGWPFDEAAPTLMVTAANVTPDQASADLTLEHTESYPNVEVTSYSLAVPFEIGAGVDVQIVGNEVTFGITYERGRPVQDAFVTLDGGVAKKTNAQGKVTFNVKPATPPRKHQLAVSAPGFNDFFLDVFL